MRLPAAHQLVQELEKYYFICSYFPLGSGFHSCKDCRREETESLARNPLGSDLILCVQQPHTELPFFPLLKASYLARNTTLVAPWGKIIFTGAMTTSTNFFSACCVNKGLFVISCAEAEHRKNSLTLCNECWPHSHSHPAQHGLATDLDLHRPQTGTGQSLPSENVRSQNSIANLYNYIHQQNQYG